VVSQQLKKSWDTGLVNGTQTVLLPKNIDNLVQNNYLVKLYLFCLDKMGYEAEVGTEEWSSKQKEDLRMNQFLRAFGISVINDEIPDLPSSHGLVWKGIASSINIWLIGQHGVDKSLFKVRQAIHPCTQLFGDVWGKNYPVEKKMLDTVIHYLRSKKMTGNISKLLLPKETIISEKGLNLEWSSDLVSAIEDSLLNEILDIEKIDKKYNIDFQKVKTIDDVKSLTIEILNRNKAIKKTKDTIKTVTSYRMTSIYSPFKGKNRDKARKRPVRELIDEIKHTQEYETFNPSIWTKIIGISPMTILYPATDEEWKKFDVNKNRFISALSSRGINESTASQIAQQVEVVVRQTRA
jgi:hypothetical protein